jgi:hypothetical protein
MQLDSHHKKQGSKRNEDGKINGQGEMSLTLKATAGDISEVGQRRDIRNSSSPNGELAQRYEDAADED